jgi:hypothetical protein
VAGTSNGVEVRPREVELSCEGKFTGSAWRKIIFNHDFNNV